MNIYEDFGEFDTYRPFDENGPYSFIGMCEQRYIDQIFTSVTSVICRKTPFYDELFINIIQLIKRATPEELGIFGSHYKNSLHFHGVIDVVKNAPPTLLMYVIQHRLYVIVDVLLRKMNKKDICITVDNENALTYALNLWNPFIGSGIDNSKPTKIINRLLDTHLFELHNINLPYVTNMITDENIRKKLQIAGAKNQRYKYKWNKKDHKLYHEKCKNNTQLYAMIYKDMDIIEKC